jgi:hypothetical protein
MQSHLDRFPEQSSSSPSAEQQTQIFGSWVLLVVLSFQGGQSSPSSSSSQFGVIRFNHTHRALLIIFVIPAPAAFGASASNHVMVSSTYAGGGVVSSSGETYDEVSGPLSPIDDFIHRNSIPRQRQNLTCHVCHSENKEEGERCKDLEESGAAFPTTCPHERDVCMVRFYSTYLLIFTMVMVLRIIANV